MATTPKGTPYVESSDLVANYPAVSLALAEHIDDLPQKILQVISTLKQDTFTTSSTSYVDVTGLSASITPSSNTNKVLVIVSLTLANSLVDYLSRGVILRDSTIVGAGTAEGSRPAANFASFSRGGVSQTAVFLDSPATTSLTVYKVQVAAESTSSATVGRGYSPDSNAVQVPRVASSVTLVEVEA